MVMSMEFNYLSTFAQTLDFLDLAATVAAGCSLLLQRNVWRGYTKKCMMQVGLEWRADLSVINNDVED